jgi:hypothetical protein
VIVWLWSAGPAEGVTDDHARARRTAEAFMRLRQTDTAIIEQASFIPGITSMEIGYENDVLSWVACRQPCGQVTWNPRQLALEMKAA